MDAEQLLARAAERSRTARAELSAAALDLFLPAEHRLTDQQRAIMRDVLTKLVASVELEVRQNLSEELLRFAPDASTEVGGDAAATAYDALLDGQRLQNPGLLRAVVQRAEEHRLMLAAQGGVDAATGSSLLEALAHSPDPELARRAVAYVVAEAKRRDRFREPLLLCDDLPADVVLRLYWDVAAALRRHLLGRIVIEPSVLDRAMEMAVRRAVAEHAEGQGGHARAQRLATRLNELGELSDELLVRSLAQGQLVLFVGGLAVRGAVGVGAVWRAVTDRGRHSLLVLLRAIEMSASAAAAVLDTLEVGEALLRPPAARRALLAAYDALELADAQRLLRGWQLDPGYRQAIDNLEAAGAPR